MIPKIDPGTYWNCIASDDHGRFKVILCFRSMEQNTSNWAVLGNSSASYGCGRLIPWASGGLYWDTELHPSNYNGPVAFDLEVLASMVLSDQRTIENPVSARFIIRFGDVAWKRIRHTSDDSICSGCAEFSAGNYQLIEMEEDNFDEPLVLARSGV